ncbi:hypothetical protein [Vannielia litorea]|uniref:hypothetical protein n=1 Tax=Vannielia litorea TaxID=1217970 RepID=UPI001BCC9B6E|nr:hypothetical protein [Vannielia litorea]MBS8227721.1 hypothetical protein [Vannielia litorea]
MRVDLALAATFALVFAAALIELPAYRWQVALAPGLAAGIGLALAGLVGLAAIRRRHAAPEARWGTDDLRTLLWFALALGAVLLLGFALGGGLYVFAHSLAAHPRLARLPVAALCGAVVPLVVTQLFGRMLQIELYRGLLLGG